MVMNCTVAIEHYKKEIMNLLGMKKWGVLNLVTVDDETKTKVYDLMDKIDVLKLAKYELDKIRNEIEIKRRKNIMKEIELPLNPDAKEPLDRKVWFNEKELKPLEPFFCVEDNEKYERYVLEVKDTKIPVYIRPSDFKKLRGE